MAARRTAILTSAREMLAEKNVADISLRELSGRIGLAKSNVLRYFDSREAIFLEILDEEFGAWLADLEARLGRPRARKVNYANEIRVATAVADSLVERQLLCELVSSMAGVLERNISFDFARDFKARALRTHHRVGATRRRPTAVVATRVHRFLRRGRAHPDCGHVSVLGADRTGSGSDGTSWACPIRGSGSAKAFGSDWSPG